MSAENASTRRILSRNKVNESVDESSEKQNIKGSNIKTEIKTIQTRSPVTTTIKPESIEMHETSITSLTLQNQQNLAASYINKEPFNEDVVVEASNLIHALKWRSEVTERFREKINEIKSIQTDKNATKAMLNKAYRQGLLLCASIKKLNRVANTRVNKARNVTHDEKNKIDEHHLELQNLLYEISHLQVEINKCLEFRSLDEDVSLVSIEEFYTKAPVEISKPDVTKLPENVHKLKLARLDWELMERQNMCGRIKELETQIESREKDLKDKQNKLESLNPKLNNILEACKPTLDYFNTNFTENSVFSDLVQHLPKPLYQFYMMMTSYRDTMDKEIQIDVLGDLDEAKNFDQNDQINFDDEDSDSNDDENDHDNRKKKSKSKANKKKLSIREKIFKAFPLSCKLKMKVPEYGELSLEFFYLNYLKIVAVKIETNYENEHFNDSSMLKIENMFSNLYPKDNGLESPNLANKFLFNNTGIKSIESYMKTIGVPYKWCQILCGLYYGNKTGKNSANSAASNSSEVNDYEMKGENKVNGKSSNQTDEEMEVSDVDEEDEDDDNEIDLEESDLLDLKNQNESKLIVQILNRLKSRFKARVVLQKTIDSTKNSKELNLQRLRIQSSLVSCKESTFDKFSSYSYTKHLLDSSLQINETDFSFYEITLLNSAAKLQAQIAINQDYPRVAPLFAINVSWKHERNFTNDEAIRDMERELNVFRENFLQDHHQTNRKSQKLRRSISKNTLEEKNYDLFPKQINHLLICFDIYLESESYFLQDNEYPRTKLFPQSVRGRDRRRPYSYMANKDLFVQRMQLCNDKNIFKEGNMS